MLGFWTPFFSPPVLLERSIHFGKQRGTERISRLQVEARGLPTFWSEKQDAVDARRSTW
ncbi:hypothetical protein LEMLEM_LOCUS15820 [Lemmus lemmus]